MEYKKILKVNSPIIISLLLAVVLVAAVWMFSNITGFSVYSVGSNKPNVTIIRDLSGALVDTTETNSSFLDRFTVFSNINKKAMITVGANKTDNESDECVDFYNDCNITFLFYPETYGFNEIVLETGDEIQMHKDNNEFGVLVECQRFSCDQQIQAILEITFKDNG